MSDRPPRIPVTASLPDDDGDQLRRLLELAMKAGAPLGLTVIDLRGGTLRVDALNTVFGGHMKEYTEIHAIKGGFVNHKGRQRIDNVRILLSTSTSTPNPAPNDLTEAISEFVKHIEAANMDQNAKAALLLRRVEELAELIAQQDEDRDTSLITMSADGLISAAKTAGEIVPGLVATAETIAAAISRWLT